MSTPTLASLVLVSTLLALPAAAAEPSTSDQEETDVVAERRIAATPEAIYAVLDDTARMAELAPDTCMRKWEIAPDGRSFQVVYLIELFRRKLDARVHAATPGRRLEWDHQGDKGFVSRFTLTASQPEQQGEPELDDAGMPIQAEPVPDTRLRLVTYVAAPGWPLRRYYRNTIRPGWTDCYDTFLEAIADEVEVRVEAD